MWYNIQYSCSAYFLFPLIRNLQIRSTRSFHIKMNLYNPYRYSLRQSVLKTCDISFCAQFDIPEICFTLFLHILLITFFLNMFVIKSSKNYLICCKHNHSLVAYLQNLTLDFLNYYQTEIQVDTYN